MHSNDWKLRFQNVDSLTLGLKSWNFLKFCNFYNHTKQCLKFDGGRN